MAAEQYLIIFDRDKDSEEELKIFFSSTLSDNKWSMPFIDIQSEESTDTEIDKQKVALADYRQKYSFYYPSNISEESENNRTNRLKYTAVRNKFFSEEKHFPSGEYSPIKASLTGDSKYYPDALAELEELVSDHLPVLDQQLVEKITVILSQRSDNSDSCYQTSDPQKVKNFLMKNIGKQIFIC
jgi:hypothetical protein